MKRAMCTYCWVNTYGPVYLLPDQTWVCYSCFMDQKTVQLDLFCSEGAVVAKAKFPSSGTFPHFHSP